MKEERLIGNSGVQEMRQQSHDAVEEIRQQGLQAVEEIRESAGVMNDIFHLTDNPEFSEATIDSEEKLLEGTRQDGSKVFGGSVEVKGKIKTDKDAEIGGDLHLSGASLVSPKGSPFMKATTDEEGKVINGIKENGNHYFGTPIENDAAEVSSLNDPEGRTEVLKDAEGRVISYRKNDGSKVECVGFSSPSVSSKTLQTEKIEGLSDEGLTEFERMLKEHGFRPGGTGDWSDYVSNDGESPLSISEPRCAMLNILSDIDLTSLSKKGRPEAVKGVNYEVPVQVEFFDMQGNYFKKWGEISGQGNSSMGFIKKNIAIDLFDDETRDGAFAVKFGGWVAQDSYHFKAFYTDFFKGVSVIAYKIAMQAQKTRGIFDDISWKKALIKESEITDNPWGYTISDLTLQTNNEARCMPDGFPIIIYQNGEFYGVFAMCLKKHRDNYHMDKGTATHIHLDGIVNDTSLFDANGNVDWTQFEVRNPKNLYYKEAHGGTYKYDADLPGQFEIADQATVNAWIAAGQFPDGTTITSKIEKQLKICAKVHKYVTDFSYCYRTAMGKATTEEKMASFETFFDPDNLIDYLVINMAIGDGDGFGPNWQWTTWDGKKWYVNQYDKDNTFGSDSKGFFINSVKDPMSWYGSGSYIMAFLRTYYMDRIVARWNELVEKGVFTKENFLNITNEWVARIGYNNLYKEYKEKWTESPCCRDPKISDNWKVKTIYYTPTYIEDTYNPETNYMAGDTCEIFQSNFMIVFECKVDNTQGIFPCHKYNLTPQYLGFYDNIWRVAKYIEKQLEEVDAFINSNN